MSGSREPAAAVGAMDGRGGAATGAVSASADDLAVPDRGATFVRPHPAAEPRRDLRVLAHSGGVRGNQRRVHPRTSQPGESRREVMAMLLTIKFGGTSVGNAERIRSVAELIRRTREQGHQVVVITSAMA